MEDSEMNRTATVRARVEPRLKADVEKLLNRLGVTTTEAITMFYSQIRLRQGLPFSVEVPNAITRKTFEATDRGEDLNTYGSLDDMFEALDKC
jgi:DNA-damage-inducible protein J